MIKSVTIRNFQKHKKLRLNLDKHVTTIVGPTDAGKSAIIRALRMLFFNKPARDTYIRHGKSKMSVQAEVGRHIIVREKGKGLNLYALDDKEYRSFGSGGVPDDISNLLRVDPVNFQYQLDLHYWFSDSAGQVSKNLNRIVNLDIIDKALGKAAALVRKSKAEEEISLSRFELAKHKKRELSWVPEFCAEVDKLEAIKEELETSRQKAATLAFLINDAKTHTKRIRLLTAAAQSGTKAVSAGSTTHTTRGRLNQLSEIINGLRRSERFATTTLPDFDSVLAIRKEADQIAEERRGLEHLLDDYQNQCTIVEQLDQQLIKVKKRFNQVSKEVCPTCGQKLSQSPLVTCTSQQSHRSLARRRGTGME